MLKTHNDYYQAVQDALFARTVFEEEEGEPVETDEVYDARIAEIAAYEKDHPAFVTAHDLIDRSAPCLRCNDRMPWCTFCQVHTMSCCIPYGTCMCS